MTSKQESAGQTGFEPETRAGSALAMLLVIFLLGGIGWEIVTLSSGCGVLGKEGKHEYSLVERSSRIAETAHDAVNTARDAFVEWDELHQKSIVDRALSLEDGQEMLAAYREDRQTVDRAFEAAYAAVAVLATVVPLVEADKANEVELVQAASAMADALAEMRAAVEKLMEEP